MLFNRLNLRCPFGMSMSEKSRYSIPSTLYFLLFTYAFLAFAVYCRSSETPKQTCTYSRTHKLHSIDCSNGNLEEVPKDFIKSNTEVLDLSYNRIRELYNDSFICCTSIKFLYLQYNTILRVESHVFAPLTSLTVLDLSSNALSTLPENLPLTLEKLFLDQEDSMIQDKNNPVIPVSQFTSLITLRLSRNKLKKFPKFNGSIPSLIELNITNNDFTKISVDDVAGLCQLKYLFISPNTLFKPSADRVQKEDFCACVEFENWIAVHRIEVTSFKECPRNNEQTKHFQCDLNLRNTTLEIYQDCLAKVSAKKTPLTLITGGCAFVLLLGIIIWLYVRHRRRTREKSSSLNNHHQNRTPANFDHVDSKTMEEKCTNPAFDSYRIQHINPPHWETEV